MIGPQESLEEYADRITASWPQPSSRQTARVSALLNTAALVSIDQWRQLEYRRYLDNETPGKHGFFTADEVAA